MSLDRALLSGNKYKPHLNFWTGIQPFLETRFIFRQQSAESGSNTFSKHSFAIQNESFSFMDQSVGKSDTGILTMLLSGWGILLSRYTGNRSPVINTPLFKAASLSPRYENHVPLLFRLENDMDIESYLELSRNMIRESYRYQNYPFSMISGVDNHDKVVSNVLMRYEGLHDLSDTDEQYDFIIGVRREEEYCNISITYRTGYFDGHFIGGIEGHLSLVLAGLGDLKRAVRELNILSAEEIYRQLVTNNDTAYDLVTPGTTVTDLFEQQVRNNPDATAVIDEEKVLTYTMLNEAANRMAYYLRDTWKVQPGDIIGVQLERSYTAIIAIMGILKSGACYLPLEPELPVERRGYMIKDAGIKGLITFSELLIESQELFGGPIFAIDVQLEELPVQSENISRIHDASDLAYIIYTSGSTGRPKGVMIAHKGIVNMSLDQVRRFSVSPADRVLQFASLAFDASVYEMFMALYAGAGLVIARKEKIRDSHAFISYISDKKVSVATLPPAYLNILDAGKLSFIRIVISAGEAAIAADALNVIRFSSYYNAYGPTECSVCTCVYQVTTSDKGRTNIPVGKPLPNTQVYILDENQQLLPTGIRGEICISGAGLAKGYLNEPQLTSDKFIPHPFIKDALLYKTGDLGSLSPDGNILFHGRIDRQIKINGYRIETGEIEHILLKHPVVENVYVTLCDINGTDYLTAYVLAGNPDDEKVLKDYLALHLPVYMLPVYYVFMKAFPLNTSGKIAVKQLPSPVLQSSGDNYCPPVTALQITLIAIWENILRRERIGIRDNYFGMGGDSLKVIRLCVETTAQTGLELPVSVLYAHPDIESLSAWLSLSESPSILSEEYNRGLEEIAHFKERLIQKDGNKLPAGYEDIYPLTAIESGMLYSSLLDTDEPVYYDHFTFELEIADFEQFVAVLNDMVQCHDIFRTRYYLSGFGEATKVVMSEVALPLNVEDLSALPGESQQEYLRQAILADRALHLQFSGDLLWHLNAYRLSEGQYFILWSVHHSMLDGWSENSFKAEFSKRIAAAVKGIPYTGVKPVHTYKDYCAVVLGRQVSGVAAEYWRKVLDGYSRNKLPFNYTGKKIRNAGGMLYRKKVIDHSLLVSLEKLAAEQQVSLKSICLSAHLYLMHVLCRADDVVTGMVTHDRPALADGDKIIGCFLNTIPVRMNMKNLSDVGMLIRETSAYMSSAKPHELHLTDISRAIGERTSSSSPVFDCIFNYTDFYVLDENATDDVLPANNKLIELDDIFRSFGMTNTLFDVEIGKTGGVFRISIKYRPDYFEASEVTYALSLYERILELFCTNLSGEISGSALLSDNEKEWLIYGFNDTVKKHATDETLHGLFGDQVFRNPAGIALRHNGASLSYGELDRRSNRVAQQLQLAGLKTGDRVGLVVQRGFAMVAGMYGIMKSGGVYVPIEPNYPAERRAYILQSSGASLVLTDDENLLTDDQWMLIDNREEVMHISEQVPTSNLAYTIYTSGSTGRPKGVMITHHAAVNLVKWVNHRFNVTADDRLLQVTSMCFDLSVYDIFGVLGVGGTVVIADTSVIADTFALRELLLSERITCWDSVPSTLEHLLRELEGGAFRQLDLRLVLLSGDWIPLRLPEKLHYYFPNAALISLGGATEGTVWSNYYAVEKALGSEWNSIPYGKPLWNNTFYILDEAKRLLPRGVAGELYIGGIGVAKGYAGDAEKSDHHFVTDPFRDDLGGRMYRTGDMGRLHADGEMEFLGRRDYQVKIRGYRVELGEIEHQLKQQAGVDQAVVCAYRDNNGNNYLCAYVVGSSATVSVKEMQSALGRVLPGYMIPGVFMLLPSLPLNSNGKFDRTRLPEPTFEEQAFSNTGDDIAANYLEERLQILWEQILGVKGISMTADLLAQGAHSLHLGSFVNRLHREMSVKLNLRDVFSHITIRSQAELIMGMERIGQGRIEPVQPQPWYPVSHAQKRLWIAHQYEKNYVTYNLPATYTLTGPLDTDALKQAFIQLINRHETLRTTFLMKDEEFYQYIQPAEEFVFNMNYRDLSGSAEQEATLRRQAQTEAAMPFDLLNGPLMRVTLIKMNRDRHVVLLTMHHIISDSRSQEVLVNEVKILYKAFREGHADPLPPLRIHYKDYTAWQTKQLEGERFLQLQQYWLDRLSKPLPVLNLPTDFTRSSVKTYNGSSIKFVLPNHVKDELIGFAGEEGASLFMLLVAAIKGFFYRTTEQDDIIVGTTVSDREHMDLDNQIGFYVNTLPLRTRFKGSDSFRTLLGKVKQSILGAYEHQAYPFDLLISDLQPEHREGHSPLFDVLVELLYEGPSLAAEASEEGILFTNQHLPVTQYDLSFRCRHSATGITVNLEYNTDLFTENGMTAFKDGFERTILNALEAPDLPVDEWSYMDHEADFEETEAFRENMDIFKK